MNARHSSAFSRSLRLLVAGLCVLLSGVWAATAAGRPLASPRARSTAAIRTFAIPTADSEPTGMVVGPDGALYFAEGNGYRVGRVTTAGQITEFPVPQGPYDTNSDEGPAHLVSSGGSLWFLTDVGSTLDRMTTTGSLSSYTWEGSDAIGLGPADTGGVWLFNRLATDDSGRSIQLQRVDPSGAVSGYYTDDENQVFAPFALAGDGSVFYGEDLVAGQYIVRQTDSGSESKIPVAGSDATDELTSLAFSSTGTLWFTEHQEYNYNFPVGGEIGELSSSGIRLVVKEPVTDNLAPENLVAGTRGTMYFTWSKGIGEIAANGHVTLATLDGYQPTGLADDGGTLWFVDSDANVVGEVSVDSLFGASGARIAAPALGAPAQTLHMVNADRSLAVSCRLRAAGRCTVIAGLAAPQARRLHLKVARGTRVVRIAEAAKTLRRPGSTRLALRLPKIVLRALRRARSVQVILAAQATVRGTRSRVVTRTVRLRR